MPPPSRAAGGIKYSACSHVYVCVNLSANPPSSLLCLLIARHWRHFPGHWILKVKVDQPGAAIEILWTRYLLNHWRDFSQNLELWIYRRRGDCVCVCMCCTDNVHYMHAAQIISALVDVGVRFRQNVRIYSLILSLSRILLIQLANCLIYSEALLEYVIVFCCWSCGCVLLARGYRPWHSRKKRCSFFLFSVKNAKIVQL